MEQMLYARRAEFRAECERLSGFSRFAAIVDEELLEFTGRPKVKEFLDRTGAKSIDDVLKYGFEQDFFASFEEDLRIIPRKKAMEFLRIEGPAQGPDTTDESTMAEYGVLGKPVTDFGTPSVVRGKVVRTGNS